VTTVRTAVIPAAGLGTRFLPASKATPKEMIPVVDKPAIQYVVEEAVRAGLTDVLIVTGRGKDSIEDHFDRSPELELQLERTGKTEELKEMRAIAEMAQIHFVRQGEPRGLGHAVSMARAHVGGAPFAVLLGDDMMHERSTALASMIDASSRHGGSVVALMEVPPSEISSYGCAAVSPVPGEEQVLQITAIVEKPPASEAPSNLAVIGRYVFTPEIFDALDRITPGSGGELQLTDAIGLLLENQTVFGYRFESGRYDIGKKIDFLRATVELALDRSDLGPEFRLFLADLVQRRKIL
jgi:UTP--glucose-1-phosphate uridylyltransferase